MLSSVTVAYEDPDRHDGFTFARPCMGTSDLNSEQVLQIDDL